MGDVHGLLSTADEVCGWTKRKCRHGETCWWDEGVRKALEDKKERFKEWKRDMSVEAKLEYKKANKSAKQSETIARKHAPDKLMKQMEVDASSKKIFKIAQQSMKDRKDVNGHECVRDRFGKLCID